jgi:hypothetical protein
MVGQRKESAIKSIAFVRQAVQDVTRVLRFSLIQMEEDAAREGGSVQSHAYRRSAEADHAALRRKLNGLCFEGI